MKKWINKNIYNIIKLVLDHDLVINKYIEDIITSEYVQNIFNEYEVEQIEYIIKENGYIYSLEFKPSTIQDSRIVSFQIIYFIRLLINSSYNKIIETEKKFDDVYYALIVLITFDTDEGWRATEFNIFKKTYKKVKNIKYEELDTEMKTTISEFFQQYNVKNIFSIIIKIV